MIRFHEVSKVYPGAHNALNNVTVEIPQGSFVFLIGHSGAGKTTMLRLLIRDMLPSKGKVFVDDWEVTKLPRRHIHLLRRKVGMVFQDFKILADRTVYENVAIGLEILGKKQSEIEKRVKDVVELVGLGSKLNFFPSELSAGEMQRTSIARAIVGGPSILLADEPTGNLDPKTSTKIVDILEEINKLGTTILMATHNSEIVNHYKKRTLTLESGEVVSDKEKGHYDIKEKHKKSESAD